jgi:hypothetical protein
MAVASAARFTADQDGMRAINTAVAALADDPSRRRRSSAARTGGCA